MRKWLSIVFLGLSGLVLLACGGDGSGVRSGTGGSGGVALTCASLVAPPDDCDKACTSDSQCEASFCQNGKCVANCTATEGCGAGSTCNTTRGRCVPNMGTGGTGGTGNSGGNACQSVTITPTRSIPNVMFLVDQSGSMAFELDSNDPPTDPNVPDRWEAAHAAITGIVSEPSSDLDQVVRLGLATYTSDNGNNGEGLCPRLPVAGDPLARRPRVTFGFGNGDDIGDNSIYPQTYPDDAGPDTPTGDSIDTLVEWIQTPGNTPPADGPTIIVLATDGEPDSCECPNGTCSGVTPPREEAVTATGKAWAAGINVYVLWVGRLSSSSIRGHLQEVANAGVYGPNPDPPPSDDAPFWIGDTADGLETAFRDIISDSISCDIQMDKRFDDKEQACNDPASDVRLNGVPLSCPTEWRVKPGVDDIIELVGSACDTFKSGDVTFTAEFPCGAIVVE